MRLSDHGDQGFVGNVFVVEGEEFGVVDFPVVVGDVVPTELPAGEEGAVFQGGENVDGSEGGGAFLDGAVGEDFGFFDALVFQDGGDLVFGEGVAGDVEGVGGEIGGEVGEDGVDVAAFDGVGEGGVGGVEAFGGSFDEQCGGEPEGGDGEDDGAGEAEAAVGAGAAEEKQDAAEGGGGDPPGPVVFEEGGGEGVGQE